MYVQHRHRLGIKEARVRMVVACRQLAAAQGMTIAWSGNSASVSSSHINGTIWVTDSEVIVDASLDWLARNFGAEAKIRSWLDNNL